MRDLDTLDERCLTYGLVPEGRFRVPGIVRALLCIGLAASCETGARLEIVLPRRGEVLAETDVTVIWRSSAAANETGDHYHVFLDRDLPAVGDPIPLDDPRIVHVVGDTTYTFHDVEPGIHRVTVVLGDAGHRARGGLYRASVPFRTRQP